MDRIGLNGIALYAYGGVSEAERAIGQRYRVNVNLWLDLSRAAASDRLEDTISYAAVHDVVVAVARERPFQLIESLAGRIVDALLGQFPVQAVEVEVRKLLPPIDGVVDDASVTLRRERAI